MADIHWEMTYDTWERYSDILPRLQDAQARGDAVRANNLIDELRSLPDYPMRAHPTEDVIVPIPKRRARGFVRPRRVAAA